MKRNGKPKRLAAQKHKEKRQARKFMRKEEKKKRKEAQIIRLKNYQLSRDPQRLPKGSGFPRRVAQSRKD